MRERNTKSTEGRGIEGEEIDREKDKETVMKADGWTEMARGREKSQIKCFTAHCVIKIREES